MKKRLSSAQFLKLCDQFGRDSFHRRPVDIRPGPRPMQNRQLLEITAWLDSNCIESYYVTKEPRSTRNYIRDLVFYFTSEQDRMIFTLCYCEIFT